MRKTLYIISFAAIALAALTSCAKEQFTENAIPAGEKIQVSINGLIGELTQADATKATAGSVVRVKWVNGDKVYVYDGTAASIGTLTVKPDANNASYALLSGEITASAASPAPTKLTLVYVKGATEAPAIAGGKISIDLSAQDQTEVPFVLYSTIDYDASKLAKSEEYISFSFATSVMTVNCTDLPTVSGNSKINITKAEINGVSTACELTVTGSGVTVAGANPGTITRSETAEPSVFTQSDSRGSFKLALAADPAAPAAPAARKILVYQGSKVSGAPFASTTLAASMSYNTVYQLGEYISNAPEGMLTGEFTVDANGKKVHFSKGNLYYDGTNWGFEAEQHYFRTYNGNGKCDAGGYNTSSGTADGHWGLFGWVGASSTTFTSSPEIYGVSTSTTSDDYGNVSGESLKADWGKAIDDEGTWFTLSGGENGEWEYLFDHHVNVWGICNSVPGRFIAPDGFVGDAAALSTTVSDWASAQAAGIVFLPAAGSRFDSSVDDVGVYGLYWSSSENGNEYAYVMPFSSDDASLSNGANRVSGCSVRLVTEASGGYAPAVKVTGVTLNKSKTEIEAGAKDTLVATVTPADATNKQVNWSSSDETVATVDENGEVTGVAAGAAVITATTASGNFTAVCLVTVIQGLPAGVLPGVFTVGNGADSKEGTADDVKVHFSQGNLTYNVSTSTWAFYGHQYDCAEKYDANLISLLTWGYDATTSIKPDGTGCVGGHDVGESFNKSEDWGYVFGGESSIWRTLSTAEWQYLLNLGDYKSDIRKGKFKNNIRVGSVPGCVIAPDDFTGTLKDTYTDDKELAKDKLVFLPYAGFRYGTKVEQVYNDGYYWTSFSDNNSYGVVAYGVKFYSTEAKLDPQEGARGYSVRLVTDVE